MALDIVPWSRQDAVAEAIEEGFGLPYVNRTGTLKVLRNRKRKGK